MRCIDADALLTDLNNIKYPGAPYVDAGIRIAVGKICDAQTIEPERKKGHWIPVTSGRGGHQCDRCGCYAPSYKSGAEWLSNFCPECNADMRGGQDE